MKELIIFTILILNQHLTAGWIGLIEYNPEEFQKYDIEDSHCFTTANKLGKFSNGEIKRIHGQCAIAQCMENRSVKLTGCAPVMVGPPCHIGDGVLSKPFPKCCYEIVCPEKEVENEI